MANLQRSDAGPRRTAAPTTRPSTRAKALAAFALYKQGVPTAVIAEREGVSEECVRLWLKTARIEGEAYNCEPDPVGVTASPPMPKRRMAQRTVLHRAWLAVHLFAPFKPLGDAMTMFWLRTVLEINELGDGETLTFGGDGDMYDSRLAFLSAHGRAEEDLAGLIRRGMLVELEGGGIAMPYRFGLRSREKAGGRLSPALLPLSPLQRQGGKSPIPGQRSFVMGMPSGTPGTVKDTPDPALHGRDDPNIWAGVAAEDPNVLDAENRGTPNFAQNEAKSFVAGGTTTTTEESESLGGGSGSGTCAPGEHFGSTQDLGADPNFPGAAAQATAEASLFDLPWVTLGAELVETAGLGRPLTVPEAELIRGWLDSGASPDMLRGVVRTVMERETCPPRPALSYFDGAVQDALERRNRAPVPSPVPRPEPKDVPEIPTNWDRDDDENPRLAAAWAKIRAALKTEVGDTDYRNWLRPMTLRGKDGDEVIVSLPSGFTRDWVRDRHGARVTALWLAEDSSVRRVNFCVREAPAVAP